MRRLKPSVITTLLAVGLCGQGCDRVKELTDSVLGESTAGSDVNPELAEIENLYASGQYDQTLRKIDEVTSADPSLTEAYYYRGLCYLALAGAPDVKGPLSPEEESSLEAFRRALSLNPRHALSNVGIGDLFVRRLPTRLRRSDTDDPEGPFVMARDAYEQAVAIDPRHPRAQSRYGEFLMRTGELERAEQALKAAVEAAATVPEIAPDYYLAYGRFLAGPADRQDEALDQFELAQMFRADDQNIQQEMAMVHARIGLRHLKKQQYMLAEGALTKAVNMFPDQSVQEAQEASEALAQLRTIRRR
ncbi:MAG: tetratricopeptide repeat protein [Acidobacteria bacterium]|nr:MAG: tetratricopeptide repeat protein [Acidobacteriota bacterium]